MALFAGLAYQALHSLCTVSVAHACHLTGTLVPRCQSQLLTLEGRVLALAQVVEDFGLVRFLPLAIEDRDSVARVLADVDRANGCAFSGLAAAAAPLPPELTYGAGLRSAP